VVWWPGLAAIGWSNRLGWYEGFHLLLAGNPLGVITGCGFGPASTKDHPLAETFFARRRHPHPGRASGGAPAWGPSVVDKGFEGQANQETWWRAFGAQVLCPPTRNSRAPWPKRLRRWRAGVRQIVETVYEKLWQTFRLDRERPHDLSGLQARVAAKMTLHNFCLWLHDQLGRPRLAFTDWVDWSLQRFHTKRLTIPGVIFGTHRCRFVDVRSNRVTLDIVSRQPVGIEMAFHFETEGIEMRIEGCPNIDFEGFIIKLKMEFGSDSGLIDLVGFVDVVDALVDSARVTLIPPYSTD
jgi:hypothetical protein